MIRAKEETEASSQRGLEFYHQHIKPLLNDEDDGRFIAIDSRTGEYEVGDSEWDVVEGLKTRLSDAEILVVVHPRIWVHSIGGGTRSDTAR